MSNRYYKKVKPGKYNLKVDKNGDLTYFLVNNSHITFYYKNEDFFRSKDLPAVEYPDGSRIWYKDGYIGRDGGLPPVYDANSGNPYYEWCYFDKVKVEYTTPRKVYLNKIVGYLLVGDFESLEDE